MKSEKLKKQKEKISKNSKIYYKEKCAKVTDSNFQCFMCMETI